MEEEKDSCIPVDWPNDKNGICHLISITAFYVWEEILEAGHDPEKLIPKMQEVGDGRLALGFYEKEEDDFTNGAIIGFALGLGTWWTSDGRMPLGWVFSSLPAGYGLPETITPEEARKKNWFFLRDSAP